MKFGTLVWVKVTTKKIFKFTFPLRDHEANTKYVFESIIARGNKTPKRGCILEKPTDESGVLRLGLKNMRR